MSSLNNFLKKPHFFQIFFQFIFFSLITFIFCSRYPINFNLSNETGEIRTVDIERRLQFINITKTNSTIAVFLQNFCRYCFLWTSMFDYASTYSALDNWAFTKFNCTKHPSLCTFYNITRFPTIKIFVEGKEIHYIPPQELVPLMEFLLKLESPVLVNATNVTDFYSKYDTFSPLVEIDPINGDKNFYQCVKLLGNSEYRDIFYFGIKNITTETNITNNANITEKIIFDYDGCPFEYQWDGNCSGVENFLHDNKFALLSKINSTFLVECNKNRKILIMLFCNLINNKTKDFVFNEYKFIAYKNRPLVFSYADYPNTTEINHYFNVKLYSQSEMKIVIFNFTENLYYVHPPVYDTEINTKEEIKKDIEKVLENLDVIYFTTGYGFKDFLKIFGMKEFNSKNTLVLIIIILVLSIGISLGFFICCNKVCPNNVEASPEEEQKVKEYQEEMKKKENEEKNKKEKKTEEKKDEKKINDNDTKVKTD